MATEGQQKLWDWPLQGKDGVVRVIEDKDHFEVGLDATYFTDKEIQVKVINGMLEVLFDHEERSDKFGTVRRSITRCYRLPEGVNPNSIRHELSKHVLFIRGDKN